MTGHIVILVLCNKVIPKKQSLLSIFFDKLLGLAKFIIRTLSGAFARVTGVNSPLSARKASFLKVTICSHKFPSNSKLFKLFNIVGPNNFLFFFSPELISAPLPTLYYYMTDHFIN